MPEQTVVAPVAPVAPAAPAPSAATLEAGFSPAPSHGGRGDHDDLGARVVGDPGRRSRFTGIFLISCATLLLELALTRVLSVALWYHFGFLVISTALLGFGASGVTLALWPRLRGRARLAPTLAALSLGFGVATVASFWLLQRIPFDPFSLLDDRRQLLFMPLYYVVIAAPFFFAGLAIALLLTRGGRDVNRLYAFDLVGAALGCALIALVMPRAGGAGSVFVAAALGCLAATAFALGDLTRRAALLLAPAGLACAAALLIAAPAADRLIPIAITRNKNVQPPGAPRRAPIYTAWNTFSRVDVYELPANPPAQRFPARRFIIDGGTAATGMRDLRRGVRAVLAADSADDTRFPSGIAYVGKAHPSILVIGSGGGAQVLDALHFGARSVTAVEINPIITDVQTRLMRDWWGGLFDQPGVRLVTDEGRSFVRRSSERYDAIVSVHTISNAAVASGALSLAENYVLTREAFDDYMDHLESDGVIYFTRPEAQLPRLFATARAVFDRRGLGPVAGHLFAYKVPNPGNRVMAANRGAFSAGFLLKRSPFTEDEVRTIERRLRVGETPTPGTPTPAVVLYSPFGPRQPGSVYERIVTARDPQAVYDASPAQLAPATDDRPFFNQHARWSSLSPAVFRDVLTQTTQGRMALEDRPVAEVTLVMLLVQAIIVAAALIILPLARWSRAGLAVPGRWRYLAYFAGLGLGFIMIEIALLQRFTLFLGQPVYTLAVVLASLLAFTGAGAALAERVLDRHAGGDAARALRLVVPALLLVLAVTALATPAVFGAALGAALPWRVAVAVLLVAPLGVMLGMPFPTGLRAVAERAPALVSWAWGVNGFFTVIGAVAALMLGMGLGFRAVLGLAAACYLVSLGAMARPPAARSAQNSSKQS